MKDSNTMNTQSTNPTMDYVVKKHSISSELAQKMVDEAVAKARELGVAENVAILDDGGNLKAFSRMDGASMPTIEIAGTELEKRANFDRGEGASGGWRDGRGLAGA